MRIVAGSARGRRLVVPAGSATRPTTDRVREAVFNSLFSLDALDEATVVDLFAGSGALGLEALSRGAAHCTFVERDRAARACVEENIASLGFDERSTVIGDDALRVASTRGPFDIALADPPYDYDSWPELLDRLAERDAGLVVAESGAELERHEAWTTGRTKRYGSTVVSILSPRQPLESP